MNIGMSSRDCRIHYGPKEGFEGDDSFKITDPHKSNQTAH